MKTVLSLLITLGCCILSALPFTEAIGSDARQNALRNPGPVCKDHPAFEKSWKSVLVRSWSFSFIEPVVKQVAYLPRYTGHSYVPVDGKDPKKYLGLDIFHTTNDANAGSFRMNFQRPATVYMFVNVPDASVDVKAEVSLRG